MRRFMSVICLVTLLGLSFLSASFSCEAGPSKGFAIVTFLQGEAYLLNEGQVKGIPLKEQDLLHKEDVVNTGNGAIVEIRLPDGSFVRFSENTNFKVSDLHYDRETGIRGFKFKLFLGKSWANVIELMGRKKGFEIASENAVAGVKGTVYRMNVNKDKSVFIRVYKGSIRVTSPPQETTRPVFEIGGPREVPGPQEVPGPREVTLKEWEYIVKEKQEIRITPDGKALAPLYFLPKEDISVWALWNKKRDESIR